MACGEVHLIAEEATPGLKFEAVPFMYRWPSLRPPWPLLLFPGLVAYSQRRSADAPAIHPDHSGDAGSIWAILYKNIILTNLSAGCSSIQRWPWPLLAKLIMIG